MTMERVADVELRPRPKLGVLQARSFKQWVRTIHLWAGIVLCLPMILIGLTGSALLAQREILRWQIPAASGGEPQSIARVVESAQSAMNPDIKPTWIDLPQARNDPASVQFVVGRRPNRTVQVFVDPATLEVLGSSEIVRRGPVMQFLVNIHEFLMLPSHIGLRTVGWIAVAMTFMGISGLYLWWPRKRHWKQAFLVKRGARGLRLQLDLHHAIGIWGLLIFLVLSLTGIYLAFPLSVSSGLKVVLPPGPTGISRVTDNVPRVVPSSPDEAVAIALKAMPEGRPVGIQLPSAGGLPYTVQLEAPGLEPAVPPVTVSFNPNNPRVVRIDDPRNYSMSERVLNIGYALHFSVGTGPVWTFLVFLAGLLPLVLAFTGTAIWWMKRQNRLRI